MSTPHKPITTSREALVANAAGVPHTTGVSRDEHATPIGPRHSTTTPGVVRIALHGAAGRMGQRILALAGADARFAVSGAIVRENSPLLGTCVPTVAGATAARAAPGAGGVSERGCGGMSTPHGLAFSVWETPISATDVVIDFSSPQGASRGLGLALRLHAALLVGTTGLDAATLTALRDASRTIPVMVTPNTSPGVATVGELVMRAARALGAGYQCSIVESHHIHKKDAPSGTAKRLAARCREGGADLHDDHVLSIRAGDIVGEHIVRFAGPGETIEITHRATTRDLFAHGALRAAAWLAGRPPGWYTIEETL